MALQLAEFLYYTPQEKKLAESLALHSDARKEMLERKLAQIRANSQDSGRKENNEK